MLPQNSKNIEGQTFGRLRVLRWAGVNKQRAYTWKCLCDCGNLTIVSGTKLRTGHTTSCGCRQRETAQLMSVSKNPIEVSINNLICKYKIGATKRGYEFLLTREDCINLFTSPCAYCGTLPQQKHTLQNKAKYVYQYNGIDRKDNNLGYTLENCVSCCGFCNRAKNDRKVEEFTESLNQLVQFRTEREKK